MTRGHFQRGCLPSVTAIPNVTLVLASYPVVTFSCKADQGLQKSKVSWLLFKSRNPAFWDHFSSAIHGSSAQSTWGQQWLWKGVTFLPSLLAASRTVTGRS